MILDYRSELDQSHCTTVERSHWKLVVQCCTLVQVHKSCRMDRWTEDTVARPSAASCRTEETVVAPVVATATVDTVADVIAGRTVAVELWELAVAVGNSKRCIDGWLVPNLVAKVGNNSVIERTRREHVELVGGPRCTASFPGLALPSAASTESRPSIVERWCRKAFEIVPGWGE